MKLTIHTIYGLINDLIDTGVIQMDFNQNIKFSCHRKGSEITIDAIVYGQAEHMAVLTDHCSYMMADEIHERILSILRSIEAEIKEIITP